jgi:CheY-like chemotaxis protein
MDSHLQDRSILVVDDIAANRLLLKRFLSSKGFRVEEAESGQKALDLCRENPYDLILMDIMMDGMNGKEATRLIKQGNENEHLPIIYVTALNSHEAYVEAMAAGGDDFISKPISFAVLEAKINVHLRIRSLYQQLERKNLDLGRFNQYLKHERNVVQHLLRDAYQRNIKPPCCVRDHIKPLSGFNGDILLGDQGPGGLYYLMLGDFTGHGLVAAIGTFPVKQTFFQLTQAGAPLVDLAREINNHLHAFLPPDIFCAAILLQLDIYSGRLMLWSGAMPDAYLISRDGQLLRQLPANHMPLGVLDDTEFDPALAILEIPLDAHLYLHTDGLTEMTNGAGEEFGEQRLQQVLTTPASGRFERVLEATQAFRQGLEQEDDIALVELDLSRVRELLEQAAQPQLRPQAQAQAEPLVPFRLELELGPDDIRRTDPVSLCSNLLAQQPGLRAHKDILHTLFAELFNNALEHSLLGLGSVDKSDTHAFVDYYQRRQRLLEGLEQARIGIGFTLLADQQGQLLEMRLEDSGRGFDAERQRRLSRSQGQVGRGLALLEQCSERLEYSADGRQVRLLYRLA